MKQLMYIALCAIILSCAKAEPVQFSETALNDTFTNLKGEQVSLQSILNVHKGKTIVLDIWASWCPDCIKGMPKVKTLQKDYPDVVYLFFSLDRGEEAWKRGIKKYNVVGEHYYMQNGKDCDFANFVNISWIPRYMLINKAGHIDVFNVVEANDEKLLKALKN